MSNENGLSTNSQKDISISNVPSVGKRDAFIIETISPEGKETKTYRNAYQWEATDLLAERLERWLTLADCYSIADLIQTLTFSLLLFRVPVTIAWALLPNTLGIIACALIAAMLLVIGGCIVRKGLDLLLASSLRLFIIAVALFI